MSMKIFMGKERRYQDSTVLGNMLANFMLESFSRKEPKLRKCLCTGKSVEHFLN